MTRKMRLSKIEVINFQCFYGNQELRLTLNDTENVTGNVTENVTENDAQNDTGRDTENVTGNVTLCHVQNGVGKTNLLIAILWAF